MCIYIYIHIYHIICHVYIYIYVHLSLSLSLYIYIYNSQAMEMTSRLGDAGTQAVQQMQSQATSTRILINNYIDIS